MGIVDLVQWVVLAALAAHAGYRDVSARRQAAERAARAATVLEQMMEARPGESPGRALLRQRLADRLK